MMEDFSESQISPDEPGPRPTSLRTRLIAANTVVTAVAIAAMALFVYVRAVRTSASLATELGTTLRQHAEDGLRSTTKEQVTALDNFFTETRHVAADAGASASGMLSNEAGLGAGLYWNAATSLVRLPNGSWDNSSGSDPASVFMPARVELTDSLATELNTLKNLDFVLPGKLRANPDAVAIYFGGVSGETLYYPDIDLASVVPPDFDVTHRPWFLAAAPPQNVTHEAVLSSPYVDAARNGLVVTSSVPVFDRANQFRGVMAMDVQLGRISALVSAVHAGETGWAFLIDRDKRLIAMPSAAYADLGISAAALPLGAAMDPATQGSGLPQSLAHVIQNMTSGQTGLDTVSISGTDRLVSYQPIPDIGYSLAIVVPSRELLAGALAASKEMETAATNTAQLSLVLVAMILAFAVLANVWLGNSLTSPLIALTQTAEEVIGGNLQAQSNVQSRDEIGILSRTLNTMTGNVREMVRSLEQRVRDRTGQLEKASKEANRRAEQFEAITRVTRAISSSRNMDQLMPLVTSVISEHFGYYHVGIFLNDEPTRQAYLIAANSEGGRRMLARHHSLRIGEQGIVGYVAARGESRVARSVGQDIVFFNNPDLPATKSEAALPLRTSDRILGVLDMQSTKDDAFTSDDLRILAALADQVVVAIENTRLYETTQRSLAETETLYRQYLQTAWRRVQPDEPAAAYRYAARPLRGSEPARKGSRAESGQPISVPIKLRGEAIGDIVVEPPADADWTQDQMDLIKAVADRVALSAENARLFDETSRRAERERLVTEITSKIRSTNDPKVMMETVQRELRQALGAAQVQIIPQVIRGGTPAEDPRDLSRLREGTGAAAQGKGAKG